ncbi:MAG: alpha/beta hydrolase [Saprospiraceae bacterium]|nr:alpha/beta hydrolase [Saprospiraceae bacterium]
MARVFILVLLLLICFSKNVSSQQADSVYAHLPKPPGRLVDIGGRSMHLYCTGCGSPTVILESGLGDNSLVWSKLMPKIAAFTRVCAYDRAGYGWSGSSVEPRTSVNIAKDLKTLLEKANESGPFVLVGHSSGGIHIRAFAGMYPQKTAGLVLLDASHEDMATQLPGPRNFPQQVKQIREQANQLRNNPPTNTPSTNTLHPAMPKEANEIYRYLYQQPYYLEATASEMEHLLNASAEEVKKYKQFKDLPLWVVARSPHWRGAQALNQRAGIDVAAIWQSFQENLSQLSNLGHLLVSDTSGHYVQLEDPALTLDAIGDAVQAAREQAKKTPIVYLNHLNLVLDSKTYQAIANASFLKDEFSNVVQTTVESEGQSWTGMYLFGEHTYVELFEEKVGVDRSKGSSAIAFGVEKWGESEIIYQRLKRQVDTSATHFLRNRTIENKEVPWFYTATINYHDYAAQLRTWVMEGHRDYLRQRFADLAPERDTITRKQYLHRIYKPERLFQDIRAITVALDKQETDRFVKELSAFDYKIVATKEKIIAEGAGIQLIIIPADKAKMGITAIKVAISRPKTGERKYEFGTDCSLIFNDDLTATWNFH